MNITRYIFFVFCLAFAKHVLASDVFFERKIDLGNSQTTSQSSNNGADNQAVAEYENGNYVEAAKDFREMAEQGDVLAQYYLGAMYYQGQGLTHDYRKAAVWLTKAANQGHLDAQYQLGRMYYIGRGFSRDRAKAAVWYRKAAEQGNAGAQSDLGAMYLYGEGVRKDFKQAAKWYRKAAEQGSEFALNELSQMYYIGRGVPKDYIEGAKWHDKYEEHSHDGSYKSLLNPDSIIADKDYARTHCEVVVSYFSAMLVMWREARTAPMANIKARIDESITNDPTEITSQAGLVAWRNAVASSPQDIDNWNLTIEAIYNSKITGNQIERALKPYCTDYTQHKLSASDLYPLLGHHE